MAGPASALIVAESPQLGESLLILLRSIPGIGAIHQANDGPSALAMSIELEPTLVLLDYHLSKNGHSNTLARMKARQPQAQFVVLVDNEDQVQRARAAGVDLVLIKGVRAATLLESIEKLLKSEPRSKGEGNG
jgi:DNA-binding NarL/FixJ family response regulator